MENSSPMSNSPLPAASDVDEVALATAVVLQVDDAYSDDTGGSYIWVQTQRSSGGCSGCHAEGSCGTSTLAKLLNTEKSVPLKVINGTGQVLEVGDVVVLELPESTLMKHTLMAYGVPLVGLFAGGLLMQALMGQSNEIWTILGSLSGMVLGWWGVKAFYRPELPIATKLLS